MTIMPSSSAGPPPSPSPAQILLPSYIDLTTLSQTELHSLSLLQTTQPQPQPQNDVVVNTPSPSSFNPSPYNKKQTFSTSPLKKKPRQQHPPPHSDSHLIITFLKHFLTNPTATSSSTPLSLLRKRKRKENYPTHNSSTKFRKRGNNGVVMVSMVNRDGKMIDVEGMEGREGEYEREVLRLAAGKEKEEELLEVLRGMEGEWCSHRRKRRVVKACLLGDALPVGWKVIIALRRRGGRFSPFCRRFVSPTGEHLTSFKEVSAYLKSHFEIKEASPVMDDYKGEEDEQLHRVEVNYKAYLSSEDTAPVVDVSASTVSKAIVPIAPEKDVYGLGIDNLPVVQISELYECSKCKLSFNVKDQYLQHAMSVHQKTTKSYKLGSKVGAGVIIRDGKFECQFCHKVFEERKRYLGHVGNHVRGNVKKPEGFPVQLDNVSLPSDPLPATTANSRMDALIQIAQSSIQVAPPALEKESLSLNKVDNIDVEKDGLNFQVEMDYSDDQNSSEEMNPHDKVSVISITCPGEVEPQNDCGNNASSIESDPPRDTASLISMIDGEVNDSIAYLNNFEDIMKSGRRGNLLTTLIPCDKVRKIPTKKDYNGSRTSDMLVLHDNAGTLSLINEGRNEESFTFDLINSGNAENNGYGGWKPGGAEYDSSVDVHGMLTTKHLLCNDQPSDLHGSRGSHSDHGAECEPKLAEQCASKESGEGHSSGRIIPQTALNTSSPFDGMFDTEDQKICSLGENLVHETENDFLNLDALENQMYNAMTREDYVSMSMDLGNNAGVGMGLDTSIGSQSELLKAMGSRSMATTMCVWCGVDFFHETADIDPQSDSVGFMCPNCRSKISKQFNDLENNFSVGASRC